MKNLLQYYCNSLTSFSRLVTREVPVGNLPLGGANPIRVQSMTTTDSMDTIRTVDQSIRMIEAGCEYVRITAPSKNEAQNLAEIKKELLKRGFSAPLIADIHFTPNAAEIAARIVEKVRINPGNYVDKKNFQVIEYDDYEYEAEIERIRERFSPLVKICKEYGTAMRIGTNHGSLSDRIMSRYGDTPEGMVESALEFVRICEELNYHALVLSMKSSNPQVMVQAYRLLVHKMNEEGMNYPLHLGVTEAGGGEDGRVKSALGIGTLLEDGIGDTIRVSLTEDPEFEPPVAIALRTRYKNRVNSKPIPSVQALLYSPYSYTRRVSFELIGLGAHNVPRVAADFADTKLTCQAQLRDIGYSYSESTDKWQMSDMAADFIFLDEFPQFDLPPGLRALYEYDLWESRSESNAGVPILSAAQFLSGLAGNSAFRFVRLSLSQTTPEIFAALKDSIGTGIILESDSENALQEMRRFFIELQEHAISSPVILKRVYNQITIEAFTLHSATDFGGLLIDGFGDGVWASTPKSDIEKKDTNRILFGILQAARTRISKTEYIACPSCGRTLFDLQSTTNRIRERTEHLKGVKIAVMGCIVNGPGEMADADYGYVGSGIGKITLYRGKEVVRRNLSSEVAVDSLIELIKEDSRWVEAGENPFG